VFASRCARTIGEEDELLGNCLGVVRWGQEETWPYEQAGAVLA